MTDPGTPMSERMQALLSRAVEDQISEQRQTQMHEQAGMMMEMLRQNTALTERVEALLKQNTELTQTVRTLVERIDTMTSEVHARLPPVARG